MPIINPALDASGNGNNWTPININYFTSGVTYDTMTDVPTNTNTNTANYATLNPISKGTTTTLSNANLNFANGPGTDGLALSTIGMSSGKWYCEVTALGSDCMVGVYSQPMASGSYVGQNSFGYGYYQTGSKYNNANVTAYGASYTTNDVIGIALDMDAGTLVFYKNNVSQGTAFSGLSGTFFFAVGNGSVNCLGAINFGQRGFLYTPPSGFVALNTFNLPTPTIGATASTQANRYMDATLWTGGGTSDVNVINAAGFAPDLAWYKDRTTADTWHQLVDSVRGNNLALASNRTDQEYNILNNGYTGRKFVLNSNGFTVNDSFHAPNGDAMVGWQWNAGGSTVTNTSGTISAQVRANTSVGFSVVTYTGTGANATVGHGLGVAPRMIIVKNRASAVDWAVYHASVGNTGALRLNLTAVTETDSRYWNNTTPTSSVFSVGSSSTVNGSSNAQVAYCFSAVAGYSAFGSYTGNGSADGQFVYLGFRPKFVMVKQTGFANDWGIFDSSRNPSNAAQNILYPNLANAEGVFSAGTPIDFLSNGFKLYGNSLANSSAGGGGYIYAAFAESPFKFANAR
jgi:hypothetical protein